MDPVNIVLGLVALAFAALALTQRMRVTDLESKVKELEAKLADRLPAPPPDPEPPPPAEPVAEDEEEDEPEEEPEAESEEEPQEAAADDDEEAEEEGEPAAEDEEEELEELDEIEPPPPEPVATIEPTPPKKAGPDPLRLAALEQVQQAFETCRYLDFDAIVRKPSTYRVTVPVTAASGPALRHLEDGMFPCLEEVRIEGTSAILHIDTSKGPP